MDAYKSGQYIFAIPVGLMTVFSLWDVDFTKNKHIVVDFWWLVMICEFSIGFRTSEDRISLNSIKYSGGSEIDTIQSRSSKTPAEAVTKCQPVSKMFSYYDASEHHSHRFTLKVKIEKAVDALYQS